MTMPLAEPEDPMTGFFWRIRWILEPLRGSKWPTPKRVLYSRSEAELWFALHRSGEFKLNFVVAEASEVGLVCRPVLRDNEHFLEFTRAKE